MGTIAPTDWSLLLTLSLRLVTHLLRICIRILFFLSLLPLLFLFLLLALSSASTSFPRTSDHTSRRRTKPKHSRRWWPRTGHAGACGSRTRAGRSARGSRRRTRRTTCRGSMPGRCVPPCWQYIIIASHRQYAGGCAVLRGRPLALRTGRHLSRILIVSLRVSLCMSVCLPLTLSLHLCTSVSPSLCIRTDRLRCRGHVGPPGLRARDGAQRDGGQTLLPTRAAAAALGGHGAGRRSRAAVDDGWRCSVVMEGARIV